MAKFSVDRVLLRADAHFRKGELDRARVLYKAVLEKFPGNARARNGLDRLVTRGPEAVAKRGGAAKRRD